MLKTIQKRMTVVLIVSMFTIVCYVTPVLAEDSGDLIAEPEFVPMLSATLSPGNDRGHFSNGYRLCLWELAC